MPRHSLLASDYFGRGPLDAAEAMPAWSRLAGPGPAAILAPIGQPWGTAGADTLTGSGAGDRLLGYQNDDLIQGLAGNDTLFGLAGNDTLQGGADADTLYGGLGNDILSGGDGADQLYGWTGTDTLNGDEGDDFLAGEDGADALYGGGGADTLYGDRGPNPVFPLAAGQEVVDRTRAQIGAGDFEIINQGPAYNYDSLRTADHDLIIVNAASFIDTNVARSEVLWTTAQIDGIEANGKEIFGYLNVAKINDWTKYWDTSWTSNGRWNGTASSPLLGAIDGDYTRDVNFWVNGWRQILFDRIDVLIAKGYSGLFLDDVLQYFFHHETTLGDGARDMRDLVTALAIHARDTVRTMFGTAAANSFAIIVNGAPELIAHTTDDGVPLQVAERDAFYGAIDGILAENYFSGGDGRAVAITVAEYGARGLALLSVDTGQATPQQQAEIVEAAIAAGFLPETTVGTVYGENTSRFVPSPGTPAPGNDLLDGGPGIDQMYGGGGDDTYFVEAGDGVHEDAGAGSDYVVARTSYVLTAAAAVELLGTTDNAGTAAINLTGNELGQTIIGNAGANTLDGGGGAGADTLAGFGGNDTYFVDANETVREDAGGGYDYVVARTSFTLTAGAEVELLGTTDNAGTAAINLTGNEFSNIILGNAGANTLNGGAGGADRLVGMAGDDTLFVDADDAVVEAAGGGYDYVVAKTSYALSAGAEIELLGTTNNAGTAALNLTGNEYANIILGNAGANVLNGGLGADRLVGNGGADSFAFTSALGGGNVDAITDFAHNDDKILLDHGVFAGLSAGALGAGAFVTGSAAGDGDDRIIYNNATGALLFDSDGTGSIAAVQFATLATGLGLSASDFTVI